MRRTDGSFAEQLEQDWYLPRLTPLTSALRPLAVVFGGLAWLRRMAYRAGLLRSQRVGVPVVIVGNITVGGTGKTPLVVWLSEALRAAGLKPGIVLRGYRAGGADAGAVREVRADSDAASFGDEAVLLARRTSVPVFAGRDRPAAARALRQANPEVDVILSDDGLQHYAMARDFEIAVFDRRGTGNGRLLPAGPLREPVSRLASVDAIVCHACGCEAAYPMASETPLLKMRLAGTVFVNLHDASRRCSAADLAERQCYAIAGTGAPHRFFDALLELGIVGATTRAFADHHRYSAGDLAFAQGGTLLMTEKDAVKCATLAHPDAWYLPVSATFVDDDGRRLLAMVMEKIDGYPPA
ncbi:MAG TPA: tetraacyldisaccharide 4'-kinase [Rhodocyclaceae bacterium]